MAVDATAMGWAFAPIRRRGKTARPRGCRRCRRRLRWSARPWRIVSTMGCRVRQWRFTAAADRSAPAPFCWRSGVAARI